MGSNDKLRLVFDEIETLIKEIEDISSYGKRINASANAVAEEFQKFQQNISRQISSVAETEFGKYRVEYEKNFKESFETAIAEIKQAVEDLNVESNLFAVEARNAIEEVKKAIEKINDKTLEFETLGGKVRDDIADSIRQSIKEFELAKNELTNKTVETLEIINEKTDNLFKIIEQTAGALANLVEKALKESNDRLNSVISSIQVHDILYEKLNKKIELFEKNISNKINYIRAEKELYERLEKKLNAQVKINAFVLTALVIVIILMNLLLFNLAY